MFTHLGFQLFLLFKLFFLSLSWWVYRPAVRRSWFLSFFSILYWRLQVPDFLLFYFQSALKLLPLSSQFFFCLSFQLFLYLLFYSFLLNSTFPKIIFIRAWIVEICLFIYVFFCNLSFCWLRFFVFLYLRSFSWSTILNQRFLVGVINLFTCCRFSVSTTTATNKYKNYH